MSLSSELQGNVLIVISDFIKKKKCVLCVFLYIML